MSIVRSERVAAVLLLIAAVIGLIIANSPLAEAAFAVQSTHLAIPGTAIDLSIGHWVSDGLLAIFFFVAAIELKHELVAGDLDTVSKAIRPAIAAVGGVLVPSLVFLLVTNGSGFERGWPIPTATDIAFALGVLAIFGKGLPARLRTFLLALAILDDIIAIIIIAIFFTEQPQLMLLLAAAVVIAGFGLLSRLLGGRWRIPAAILMVVLALLAWGLVSQSGVHATIAGVGLGLVMKHRPAMHLRHTIEPFTNGFVLPVFALSAALVAIPQLPISELSAPFWAILIALPVGKIIGIGLGGWLSTFVGPKGSKPNISLHSLLAAGALGGIGFTVSLLMNELAFAGTPEIRNEGTLAVLLGSGISIVLSGMLVSTLAAKHRRERALHVDPAP
ncbi:MAG TPA: Na+/H+ antiporter NhaA [Plantibacter sp.]|uniref:Na+/H+ antiporter NhaA n=1 Tax=unclassified Plantibacter TaxID=2624265 RepID=UPI002D0EAF3A|nr:Na+/H+ antiporter NhaA [Plantibacter sp.]